MPSDASDVPLSTNGCLYILSAWLASRYLFQSDSASEIELPDFTSLINATLESPSAPGFGTESPAILDSLFFLGLYTLHTDPSISPSSDQEFNDALQRLSLLSAQLPSPSQRYQAHQLASTLLHLHPSNEVKLSYIKDTLEHCPYENLKASAVGWVKDEILSANMPSDEPGGDGQGGIFASPALLDTIGEWLWGDRVGVPMYSPHEPREQRLSEFSTLQSMQTFYLGVLNLLFLLLSNETLYKNLGMADLLNDIKSDFIESLLETATGFEKAFQSGGVSGGEESNMGGEFSDLSLLVMNCQQILDKIVEKEKG